MWLHHFCQAEAAGRLIRHVVVSERDGVRPRTGAHPPPPSASPHAPSRIGPGAPRGASFRATATAAVNESVLRQMAAEIREEIPEAEVRLFGSHARGDARPDSDIDLLIKVSDDWLSQHNRFEVLDRLRWRLSQPIGRWICRITGHFTSRSLLQVLEGELLEAEPYDLVVLDEAHHVLTRQENNKGEP